MRSVDVEAVRPLRFDDGRPVRAASAVAPLAGGWLVAQDDAAHAAWVRSGGVTRVRVVPPVEGHDLFAADGMKHLKPDFEAACPVEVDGAQAVLLLGSGSAPARMRAAVVGADGRSTVADLTPLYAAVAEALGRDPGTLNLEGACLVDGVLRWFARGNRPTGTASGSVDVEPAALVRAVLHERAAEVRVGAVRTYDLGEADGVGLEVTDAVALPDGRILLSATAEDAPNAIDDGPVVASALALVDGDRVVDSVLLPEIGGRVHKVEGLALMSADATGARLLAVVDDDDDTVPSASLVLRVRWS